MAIRNPLVYVNGYPQELASSDRLNGVGKKVQFQQLLLLILKVVIFGWTRNGDIFKDLQK